MATHRFTNKHVRGTNVDKTYHIGEFSTLVNTSAYTIRYYEKEGLLKPNKENGQRIYDDHDVLWFQFLQHLKGAGLSLFEMKQYVDWRSQGDGTIEQRQNLLKTKRNELEEQIRLQQEHLQIVNDKIDFYDAQKNHTVTTDFETFRKQQHAD